MKIYSLKISATIFAMLIAINLMAQLPESIDVTTATYDAIFQYIVLFMTMIWGQLAKLIPSIKNDVGLPKVVYIVLGAGAVGVMVAFQGWGSIAANLMSILAALGAFDLLKGLGGSTQTPEEKAAKLIAKAANLIPKEKVQEIAQSIRAK